MSNKNKLAPQDDTDLSGMLNPDAKKYYRSCKHSDKLRRFTYTNWCPICEADTSRRRSKSESLETFTGKRLRDTLKSEKPKSSENNASTYGVGDARNILETSRIIRANLCELPTTYINNCATENVTKFNGITRFHYISATNPQIENRGSGADNNKIKEAYYHEAYKNLSPTRNFINRINTPRLEEFPQKSPEPVKRLLPTPRQQQPPQQQQQQSTIPIRPRTCTPEQLRSDNYNKFKNEIFKQNKSEPVVNEKQLKSCYVIECQANKKILPPPIEVAPRPKSQQIRQRKIPEPPEKPPTPVPPPEPDADSKRNRIRPRSESESVDVPDKPETGTKKPREISPLQAKKELKAKSAVKLASIKNRHKISVTKLRKVRNKIAHSVSSDSNLSGSESGGASDFEDVVVVHDAVEDSTSKGSTPTHKINAEIESPNTPYTNWPLRASLFAHVPPYVKFSSHDVESSGKMPHALNKHFKWRLSNITPIVVRKTLSNTGFRLVRNSNDWTGTWGKHIKSIVFQTLKDSQKLNHFPGTFQIGRKDRLWKNLQRLMFKFGMKEFGFIPRTFVLPHDLKLLRQAWEKTGMDKWIIKPPASARGTGIRVIHRWAHLPKKKSLVVQQYISNPYLINGSKFDLRLYVLVTSFNPLRIYLYPEGLARFASTKYSDDLSTLSDRYMHLTNYSINKLSSHYAANEDANACKGHKWTLSKLWEYLEKDGVNTRSLWRSLQQLVIKTMLCGESSITQLYKQHVNSRYNCYELFGVDVLLDERLKPWLLEVNISPSLHSASPLDLHVKGPLVQSLLNLAQFHLSPKMGRVSGAPPVLDSNLYTMQMTTHERLKHLHFIDFEKRDEYLNDILRDLTGDDVRHLITAEDELTVIGNFERIFPTQHTHFYFQFMEPRYYNRLFDAWENRYEKNRIPGIKILQILCEKKVHLDVPPITVKKSSDDESTTVSTNSEMTSSSEDISKQQTPQVAPRLQTTPVPVLVDPTIKALRNEIRYKLMNLSMGMGLSPF